MVSGDYYLAKGEMIGEVNEFTGYKGVGLGLSRSSSGSQGRSTPPILYTSALPSFLMRGPCLARAAPAISQVFALNCV